jgi:hypothetical protein
MVRRGVTSPSLFLTQSAFHNTLVAVRVAPSNLFGGVSSTYIPTPGHIIIYSDSTQILNPDL